MEFYIARQEGMKDIEGEKDFQEKTFDSTAFVLVDMVCTPVVRSGYASRRVSPAKHLPVCAGGVASRTCADASELQNLLWRASYQPIATRLSVLFLTYTKIHMGQAIVSLGEFAQTPPLGSSTPICS
jgi:hypothetical protein